MRTSHKVDDIQQVVYSLFNYLSETVSPFTDWDVILNYPDTKIFENFEKPIIYIESPKPVATFGFQGGENINNWSLIIGLWVGREHGGPGELNIMESQMLSYFNNLKKFYEITFPVELGGDTFTDQTLFTQGILFNSYDYRPIDIDNNDFRCLFTINLTA